MTEHVMADHIVRVADQSLARPPIPCIASVLPSDISCDISSAENYRCGIRSENNMDAIPRAPAGEGGDSIPISLPGSGAARDGAGVARCAEGEGSSRGILST